MKLALSAAILIASIAVKAQTADDIINKHIDAVGGKDVLNGVKTMVLQNSINAMGNDNAATTTVVIGKGYKTDMDMNGQKLITVVTDKGGWTINPFQGGSDAQPLPDDQYKGSEGSIFVDPFLDYAAHGDKVELEGTEGSTYKLKVTNKDNSVTTYYIDTTTYYITKAVRSVNMMGNDVDLTFTFSDQKKTDFGNVIPFTIQMDYGTMFSMTSTVKKATVNGDVDPKVFDMPAK